MPIITEYEADRLLAAIDTREIFAVRNREMLRLVCHTGLRVSELCGLTAGLVSHNGVPRQVLLLPAAITKGHHARIVPLNTVARECVAIILAFNKRHGFSVVADALLLVSRRHQPISVRCVAGLREAAGLDVAAVPHSLRHLFASNVARRAGVHVCKELLGHARLETVATYAHVTREDLVAAVNQLSGHALAREGSDQVAVSARGNLIS
ncbi:MAG: hypothetical protein FJX76_12000 [Armatimonadetes bacterium]|nr:hypothetical protein [Armatimonadota bacterium]